MTKRSLLEAARQALAEAEERLARDPTDENAARVERAQALVRNEQAREPKRGPVRPPDGQQ